MHASYLIRVTQHFCIDNEAELHIASEVDKAKNASDVRKLVPLTRAGVEHFSQFYPPVKNAADLDNLSKNLTKDREIGFSPLFDPHLIDACCQRGIFPLSILVGEGIFLFAPKLHIERAVSALVDNNAQLKTIEGYPFCEDGEGIFLEKKLGISRKLMKQPDAATRRPSFMFFVNRPEDLADVFTLIKKQHGENWLCEPLRVCLMHMFLNPSKYETKIIIVAVRRVSYGGEAECANTPEVREGELVAGEVGYIVGDIYTSASGAYCLNGGGALQLYLTGISMRSAGCRLWDLGMLMDYKKVFNCVCLPRKKWQKLVSLRRSNSNAHILSSLHNLQVGRPVGDFVSRESSLPVTSEESKSKKKKRLKMEACARWKAERRANA